MKKDTLTLKDNTVIELESSSSLSALKVLSSTKEDMIKIWSALTKDNLSKITIKNSDGLTVATYDNLVLVSETSSITSDGTIETIFKLRQLTDIELRLDALEESQLDQDDAIVELAEIVAE